jgi:hypothetical protein
MLSILIPVYNFDVAKLVNSLNYQAENAKIKYEIILADDCSENKYKNKELEKLKNALYIELSENYGRSKIRNYLANLAKYDNLIFLDCDMKIISTNFIDKYIKNSDNDVVCGGHIYNKVKPTKDYLFHWTYGTKVESKPSHERNINSNNNFQTGNFFIKKRILNAIKFNEQIKEYGHEDTLFGYELKKRSIKISHINNPTEHLGLEKTEVFISKTKKGIENLYRLSKIFQHEKQIFDDIRLLKYFFKLKKMYFCWLLKLSYKIFNKLIYKNLMSNKPSLFFFDLFKLGYLCSL